MTATRGPAGAAPALWILAAVAVVYLLRSATQLRIPIVIAVLFSYALEPVVAGMARYRVPRVAGAAVLLMAILGLLAWGTYSLRHDALKAVEAVPTIARRARELVWPGGDVNPAQRVREAAEALQSSAPPGGDAAAPATGSTQQPPPSPVPGVAIDWVQRAVGSIVTLSGHVTVIVFLVFFLLNSGGHFRKRILEIAGSGLERQRVTARIIDDINAQIQRFLLVTVVTSVVVGTATWVVLAWMGVAQAAVWAILAGVFNSIPYFGPVIVSGGLLLVGLVQSSDPMYAVTIAGAALVITSIEGWLLTPQLMGKAERMHVVVVFLGVLIWTWIWGAWGTILAVPMLVIVKSIADHVERLKPVSRLMAP